MKWLREQVTQRMETAKEACHDGDGNWWRRLTALYVGREPIPDGALYEGTPEVDDPEHDIFLAEIVVYDEGRPSDQQFAHIALNDPQDVIARCEAELAILDAHAFDTLEKFGTEGPPRCTICLSDREGYEEQWEGDPWPCQTVRLVASGYKHREGYAEHWSEGR